MNKNTKDLKKKNKKAVVTTIILTSLLVIVTSLAYFTPRITIFNNSNNTISGDVDSTTADITVTGLESAAIDLTGTYPMTTATATETLDPLTFTITNNSTKLKAKYNIILDVKNGNTLTKNELISTSLGGVLTTGTEVNATDSGYTKGYIIYSGVLDAKETKEINLRVWINENGNNITGNANNVESKTWLGKIIVKASKGEEVLVPTGAETLIAKANAASVTTYSSGNTGEMYTFTHSDIDTSLATQVASWTSNELTDYRYIGANPNNYVYFNCTDPTDTSTCEVWRIIGVFTVEDKDGNKAQRIKLIRNATIGNLAWNSSNTNEWVGGSLATLLNSGDYYTRSGSYASNGLTSSAKSMINEKTKFYLGGYNKQDNLSGSTYYSFERGTTVYSGRSTSVIQEVGLMYPSDFVYTYANGVDNTCYTDAYDCDGSTPSSGWIYNTNTAEGSTSPTEVWTVSPNTDYSRYAFSVDGNGIVYSYFNVDGTLGVRPVVYLNSDIEIDETSGDGSLTRPYSLKG